MFILIPGSVPGEQETCWSEYEEMAENAVFTTVGTGEADCGRTGASTASDLELGTLHLWSEGTGVSLHSNQMRVRLYARRTGHRGTSSRHVMLEREQTC